MSYQISLTTENQDVSTALRCFLSDMQKLGELKISSEVKDKSFLVSMSPEFESKYGNQKALEDYLTKTMEKIASFENSIYKKDFEVNLERIGKGQ